MRGPFPKDSALPEDVYGEQARLAKAEEQVSKAAEGGYLEQTQGWEIARTYRVPHAAVKAMKAKFRNELSFNGDGK